ncbi:ABC transporter substrate-binding protein [Yeguia hominis]|uniref:Sugar ABC transporter substrate-binding protein n=1 Tax=Yeguia hominis TaxID=2763662 RepID=A0A926D8L0_9FIRM|nr:sugar ABC transporter substrate-binding protein [Yeguia hominis]MBC8533231.1 sugar ABC transporter substrate-binding protein [Yeguia hominis]
MKKVISIVLVCLLMITSCLTGCGSQNSSESAAVSGGNGSSQQASAEGETTPITFWLFNDVNLGYWEEMERSYNEKNPDAPIDLIAEPYPVEEMHNKLQIAIQSGSGAPDIADVEISRFPNFLKGDIPFADLTGIVDPVREDFVESRFEIYSKDGKVYGLPLHVGATMMFYNTEILAQAGAKPEDIETWDDFVEVGKKVKAATGKPMTTVETTDVFGFFPLIIQQGSDFFEKDGSVIINNETNVKTLQFLYDMVYTDEIAVPTPGGNHHAEEFYSFFNQGGSAALMMPMWYMLRFVNYMPELQGKVKMYPLPRWTEGGDRSAGMGGTGTVAIKSSPVLEKAIDFLDHSKLSEEAQIDVWTILGFDPPRHSVWDSEEMKEDNQFTDYFDQDLFSVLLEVENEIDSPTVVEGYAEANNLVAQELMFTVIGDQSKTPKEALDEIATKLSK